MSLFKPRLIETLKDYSYSKLMEDTMAGVTVGIVALPLAMAFGIASGVTPEAGIFTAIIAGFLMSLLGGSRVQIGGPAGAFIVLVYGIISAYGLAHLLVATMLAGVLILIMGYLKLGLFIRFIPVSIVIGFTNGIAVLIAISQLKDFLGLHIAKMPGDFLSQIEVIVNTMDTVNFTALGLASLCLVIIILWTNLPALLSHCPLCGNLSKICKRLPATLIALVVGAWLVYFFKLPVETIGSKFNGIPEQLPSLRWPAFDFHSISNLLLSSISIALLSSIESLLCARVADNLMSKDPHHKKHDANQELIALGLANIVTPLFGGIPSTGTIARTTTNVQAGAQSPIAGIIHALTLLVIILIAAPLAYYIPLPALAAILMFIAYSMGEWREFKRLSQFTIRYRTILLSTFFLTVVFNLAIAIEIGLLLACLFFIYRVSSLTVIKKHAVYLPPPFTTDDIVVYDFWGSLFFGTVDKIETILDHQTALPRVTILSLHQLFIMDTTGLDALVSSLQSIRQQHKYLLLCNVHSQPYDLMHRSGFFQQLGQEVICNDLDQALKKAQALCSFHPIT